MKLISAIESEFKNILLAGLGISLVAIMIFGFFSAKDSVEKATTFIESHVSHLTEGEINFQNIADIDHRVRQVYESWIRSEGIDLRIEVYVDGKLVAKAGPMQKFGLLSRSTKRDINLSSGNHVTLNVDVDLFYLTTFALFTILCSSSFLLLCFWQLRKKMRRSLNQISGPLEERVSWIQNVSNRLPESLAFETQLSASSIEEIANLDKSFDTFISRLRLLEKQVSEKSFSDGRVKMAEQVAHSLKGVIGTLGLLLDNNPALSAPIREEIQDSIHKMRNISSGMLSLRKLEERQTLSHIDEEFYPSEIIESVVHQKGKLNHKVVFNSDTNNASHITLFGPRVDFETTISNIIDNAIEAMPNGGTIKIALFKKDKFLRIEISDTGIGIPDDILPQLMKEGVTFKENGNGLGLYHAKNTVAAMNGFVALSSKVGAGTSVEISLPIFCEKIIDLAPGQQLVIVDDDLQIHRSWDLLLSKYKNSFDVTHIYSENEFEEWIRENGPGALGSRFYIFDYDLKSHRTGIDLINKFNLRLESVVVSGMFDDENVIRRAKDGKIQLWDKSRMAKIKLKISETKTETPLEAANL